jgi:hypothetical protein
MRPDTEANPHAARVMAGAAVITIVVLGVHTSFWFVEHYATIALGTALVGGAGIASYIVGAIVLDVIDGGV